MPRYLLDRDPLSGATETFEYDEAEDRAVIKRSNDVEPVLDRNKALFNEGPRRGEFRLAASIPLDVALLWREQKGIDVFKQDHWPAVVKLLNDPDWRYLRTSPGRL
jgi:hypothetical protein